MLSNNENTCILYYKMLSINITYYSFCKLLIQISKFPIQPVVETLVVKPTPLYEGGIKPSTYEGDIKLTTYEGGIKPTTYEDGIKPTTYEGGIKPTTYEGGIKLTIYEGGIKVLHILPSKNTTK